jgi:tetratricopeptide (TPR) repeat protein
MRHDPDCPLATIAVNPVTDEGDTTATTRADRMRRMQEIFHDAADRPVGERASYLDVACAGDSTLRAAVARLLEHDIGQDADATIAARVLPVAEALAGSASHGQQGQRIGGYQLIEEIGSGGMGTVFLAHRDDREFRHQAAIKLVRGFPTAPVLERFRRERELLATLRHPNIARLFDGGTTEGGQPYLVMEYIDGMPLDAWCAQRQPSLTQRLRLFQSLCSAVQHAHQQLIVHRDLKPANVLVRNDGEPVLLDFGIGTLLNGDAAAEPTQFSAMTPAYASPEQLGGEPATTLSDIFGLGLILFELLAGVPLRKQGGDTTRLVASQVAAKGESWLRPDARTVRGDLDNIVRKALREEPQRRYPTAAALSADIDCWFEGRPVTAAPDSLAYRTRKFVTRHPVALGATAATIIVLALLSFRLATERDRAVAAQEQARIEAEGANQSAVFLVDLFKAASPESTRGAELTVRDLIGQAQLELQGREFSRPEVKARLETALGEIYYSLGLPQPSTELLEQAVARIRSHGDSADGRVLARALTQLARAYSLSGRDPAALEVAREGLALNRRLHPAGHPEIGHSLQTLGVVLEDVHDSETARRHFEEAERLFAAAGDDYRHNHAATLHNLGWSAYRRGDHDEARRILSRALAVKLELNGTLHPSTFMTVDMLARVDAAQGNFDAAADRLKRLLADEVKLLGQPNHRVATTHNELGSVLQDAGRFSEAAAHYKAAITQRDAIGDDAASEQAISVNNYGTLLEDSESFAESEARYRQALAMRKAGSAAPQAIARGQHNLARLLLAMGRIEEARALADESWSVRGALVPTHHPERLDAMLLQTRIALARDDRQDMQRWHDQYRTAASTMELSPAQRARAHELQALLAESGGDRVTAVRERRALVETEASRLPGQHPQVARQRLRLAALLARGSDAERREAAELLAQARGPVEAQLDAAGPTRALLAELLSVQGSR